MPAHTLQPFPLPRGCGTPSTISGRQFWRSLLRRMAGIGAEVFSMPLSAGQELRLHEVAGWTLVCRSGALWITQEADTRDIFLKGDEGFALDRGGLALVCACRDSMLSIRAPARRGVAHRFQRVPRLPPHRLAASDEVQLAWLRSLYPECGPWNDPASYRRPDLLSGSSCS